MGIPCFWIEPTERAFYAVSVWCNACDGETRRDVDEADTEPSGSGAVGRSVDWEKADWPTECEHCGRTFSFDDEDPDADSRSSSAIREFRRTDTGEKAPLSQMPVGAMWHADWMVESRGYPTVDGHYLVVNLPGDHHWSPDSRASNCTRPTEDHDCWCRHGTPPLLTVDKQPEPGRSTCDAGGGSIQNEQWHGFVRNGELVT